MTPLTAPFCRWCGRFQNLCITVEHEEKQIRFTPIDRLNDQRARISAAWGTFEQLKRQHKREFWRRVIRSARYYTRIAMNEGAKQYE